MSAGFRLYLQKKNILENVMSREKTADKRPGFLKNIGTDSLKIRFRG